MRVFGGIEAGGTKFVCAVGRGPGDIRAETRFPATCPSETLDRAITFFRGLPENERPAAIGIASFGPVDPNPESPTFGYITNTPKRGWVDTDFAGTVHRATGLPVGFDTDTNAAALAEHRWGAAQGLGTFLYLTIGTGIGGGGMIDGRPLHGLLHPEMGHIRVPRHPQDSFPGNCPFHGDCLEGLAAGPALAQRWGHPGEKLPVDHAAWEMEAHYLALGVVNFICTLSPQRIILGGGVMAQRELFPRIRNKVLAALNGYVHSPAVVDRIDEYLVPPGLGERAGVLGGIALAESRLSLAGS